MERYILAFFLFLTFQGWAWATGGSDTPEVLQKRIKELIGQEGPLLTFNNLKVRSVLEFLEKDLASVQQWSSQKHQLVSWVHGDLNGNYLISFYSFLGNNVLIDENMNIWLIDFFFTGKFHVLKDICKVENDIMYQYTILESDEELNQALQLAACFK
jgi:hypothetical protein